MKYKIWAQIEALDDETGEAEDLHEQFEEVGEYDTLEEAQAALDMLVSQPMRPFKMKESEVELCHTKSD